MTYAMTCSCGMPMEVEADSREEAVQKLSAMMTPEAVAAHMAEKHDPSEAIPSQEEVHAQIENGLQPTAAAA